MKKTELLARLRGDIPEAQWAALAEGGAQVSAFNRGVLLEMRQRSGEVPGEVDAARVRGLKDALEDYLGRYLPDAPEAWVWIVTASLYLTFIAERPMHPMDRLGIAERTSGGRTVFFCPMKSEDARSTCRYCVCEKAAK